MAKTPHQPFVQVNAGDQIQTPGGMGGFHVVLKPHVLPLTPYRPGYSDDNVHWSVGKSQ